MVIREQVQQEIDSLPEGVVVTASDFEVPRHYRATLIKALNQFEYAGVLKKVSKGKYYKPRQSRFGEMKPSESEIVKDFLQKEGKTIGYITGTRAFSGLTLTTQISTDILIGTNVARRPLQRGPYKISFLLQPNSITSKNIPLLIILDALRLIKEIPASTPEEALSKIIAWIKVLSASEQKRLASLAMKYRPYVRALTGAILEHLGCPFFDLQESLNPLSRYHLDISASVLPTSTKWNIV